MSPGQSSLALVGSWLANEVGQGNIFTKQQLRAALPQFEQADRRMRDLRAYGWRIDTNRQDAVLRPHELRLVDIGAAVWAPSFRPLPPSRISSKERLSAISAADFRCQMCGIQIGQQYLFSEDFARLEVSKTSTALVVACEPCLKGAPEEVDQGTKRLREMLAALPEADLRQFKERAKALEFQTPLEAALSLASRLPGESVAQVAGGQSAPKFDQTAADASPGE